MNTGSLSGWTPRQRPARRVLEGRYVRLEPLEARRHGSGLFAAASVSDAAERFRWLFEYPPAREEDMRPWLENMESSEDPLCFCVLEQATGRVGGRQSLMRIEPQHGVIEIGGIYWGPPISRRPAATEAMYLFARYVFDVLGYRRFEWKCHSSNEPSRRAAVRFGFTFEGIFRQHMVFKGGNRDTAWYSMLDVEWTGLRTAYEAWLDPVNFDSAGMQRRRLEDFRRELARS